MPKGYVILTEAIKDPEGMKAYGRAAGAAMGGVNILAVDTKPAVIEGDWHGDQTVVLEFESVDAARAWYESDAYQAAAKLRQAGGRLQCGHHLRICLSRLQLRRYRWPAGPRRRSLLAAASFRFTASKVAASA